MPTTTHHKSHAFHNSAVDALRLYTNSCYACSAEEGQRQADILQQQGAMSFTSVVSAASTQNLGERYATLCSACSRGERIRDSGGHALVVLDDIRCLVMYPPFWGSCLIAKLIVCCACQCWSRCLHFLAFFLSLGISLQARQISGVRGSIDLSSWPIDWKPPLQRERILQHFRSIFSFNNLLLCLHVAFTESIYLLMRIWAETAIGPKSGSVAIVSNAEGMKKSPE